MTTSENAAARPSRRAADEMRPVTLERGVSMHAEGSCLIRFGKPLHFFLLVDLPVSLLLV